MPLEASCLDNDTIIDLVKTNYGYNITDIRPLPLGSANCYMVSGGNFRGFLKEFQSGFDITDINREDELIEYLSLRGIPTVRIYRTKSGDAGILCQNHAISLSEYIDGETYDYNSRKFPREYTTSAIAATTAAMLGKIHAALTGYNLPVEMGSDWLAEYSPESCAAQYDTLLCRLDRNTRTEYYDRIRADLCYKKSLALRFAEWLSMTYMSKDPLASLFSGLTYTPTHGDYHSGQLIYDGVNIKAVIDFSSAATLPAVWEIMRSYVQSFREYEFENIDTNSETAINDTDCIDIDSLCRYFSEYMKYSPLSQHDLEAAPYVYLFQLLRSKYGYKQYLDGTSSDNLELLQFALRRTNICRELERSADKISTALKKLL